MAIGDDITLCVEDHAGAGGSAAVQGAGNGHHRGDILLIDLLQRKPRNLAKHRRIKRCLDGNIPYNG